MGNSKTLILAHSAMDEVTLSYDVNVMLTPQFYTLKKEPLPVQYAYQAKPAGVAINDHGYNSPVLGADQHANDNYKKNFAEAYPGDALANLNPWPPQAPWYAKIRTEYVNKFKSS